MEVNHIRDEWFKETTPNNFAGERYHSIYSKRLTPARTQFEIETILSLTKCKLGAKILDIPCGCGRHTNALANRGFAVTGVDISSHLLSLARKNDSAQTTNYVTGDMRTISLPTENFDIGLSLFTGFGYFQSRDEDVQVLKKIHSSLKTGGDFFVEYMNSEKIISEYHYPQKKSFYIDNVLVKEKSVISDDKKILSTSHTTCSAELKTSTFTLQLYTKKDLIKLLEETGFVLKNIFGDYDLSQYKSLKSPRVFIHAEKLPI